MAFTNNFRIERIYFEKLKSNIDILKSYIEAGATGEALELLKNSVDVDGAVLLLYRNLGEAWAELADLIQKTQKDLKDLAEKTEAYHDELNERIDEVNNYLMALIRELDARLQVVEQDLATMNRNKFYDLVENNGSYLIEKDGVTVSFDDIKEDADFPHDVILRYDNGTSVTELEIREFTNSRIDFYSIGLTDSDKTVKEILVSITDTEAVTYSENTLVNPLYTFGTGLSLDSDNELSVDFTTVQAKLTEGTGIDIDSNNEISVDTSVIQEKLTEGTGIDIDSNNEISVDTSVIQAKLTEGTGIDIDSNNEISVDTSVVQPKLSEGFGIDIDSNNEIKVDTAQVQEKLIAGQNITLTPDTTDPTKTVIDASGGPSYTAGTGIDITNNVVSQFGPLILPTVSEYKHIRSNTPSDFVVERLLGASNEPKYYRFQYTKYETFSRSNYKKFKVQMSFLDSALSDTTDHGLEFVVLMTPSFRLNNNNMDYYIRHSFAPREIVYGYNIDNAINDCVGQAYTSSAFEFTALNIPKNTSLSWGLYITGTVVVTKNSNNLSDLDIRGYIQQACAAESFYMSIYREQ